MKNNAELIEDFDRLVDKTVMDIDLFQFCKNLHDVGCCEECHLYKECRYFL